VVPNHILATIPAPTRGESRARNVLVASAPPRFLAPVRQGAEVSDGRRLARGTSLPPGMPLPGSADRDRQPDPGAPTTPVRSTGTRSLGEGSEVAGACIGQRYRSAGEGPSKTMVTIRTTDRALHWSHRGGSPKVTERERRRRPKLAGQIRLLAARRRRRTRWGPEQHPCSVTSEMAQDDPPSDSATAPVGRFSEESPLQVLVSHRAEGVHVALSGELDGATAPFLVRTLVEVNKTLAGDLVLDIRQLSFIDSTGLSVFVSQQKQLSAKGRKLVIFGPTAMTRRLFQITGLEDVLTIEPLDGSEE